jgi:DNA-binding GntR family transcriptional regulator
MAAVAEAAGGAPRTHTALRDAAIRFLQQKTLSGELPPGARLNEIDLAQELGISKTPMREAILDVARTGLLRVSPYRGASVLTLDRDLIQTIYDARLVIEEAAVRRAVTRLTEADFAGLERHLRVLGEAVAARDRVLASQEDLAFHTLLYERAEQSVLLEMWEVIRWRIGFFLVHYRWSSRPSPAGARDRHLPLLMALRSRDVEAAAAAAREHVTSGTLLEIFETVPQRQAAHTPARAARQPRIVAPPSRRSGARRAVVRMPR